MSVSASTLINCNTFQAQLEDYWQTCSAVKIREPLPLLELLYSSGNRAPIVEQIVSGGKIKSFELLYNQRLPESGVSANQPNPTCTASNRHTDKSTTYTLDPNINLQTNRTFNIRDTVRICKDTPTYFNEQIQLMIDQLMRKVATTMASEAVTLAGAWASDVTVNASSEFEFRTLRSGTTDELAPFGMENINMALLKSGYCNQTTIIGGTSPYQYMRRMQSGCCAQYGNDLSAIWNQYGMATLWDRRLATALGSDDKALAIQAGALQVLVWNAFEGMVGAEALNDDAFKQMVIQDPMTGFPIDMVVKYDCGDIHIVMTVTHKVIALPLDLAAAGDTYRNVNWVGKLKVVN